ncbi:MAG TPA: LamG-like jellyroll fold domain-containing protein [Chitinivibrionales bacterium]|nr:LamG-like jellyroll fold domain-containing protein [Chitinivibrionales bacterium]
MNHRSFFFQAFFLFCYALALNTYSLPAGTIAYYPLDNNCNDYSGNGNNGSAYGGPAWVAGYSGNALYCDGVNDYVSVPNSNSLTITNQLSVSAWIKPEKGSMWYRIVGMSNSTQSENTWCLGMAMNGGIYFCVWNSNGQNNTNCSQLIPLNKWSHVAGTWDGTTLRAYLNGVLQPEQVAAYGPVLSSTGPLIIGRKPDNTYYFQGAIDEVIIFNRALSQSEITGLYNFPPYSSPILIPVPSPTTNRRPALSWHTVPQAAAYTVQVDTTRLFAKPCLKTPLLDTTYQVPIDLPVDTIYWQVIAGINDSTMYYSEIGSFVIQDPRVPLLIPYEPKVTQERRPALAWHPVAGATTYTLEAATNGLFTNLVLLSPMPDTHYVAQTDFPISTIYWRVKSDLVDKWSTVDTFQIMPDTIPFLIRFNGATLSTKRPTFLWHPVANAGGYRIEAASDRNFTQNYTTVPVPDTFYAPLVDMTQGTWFWHVSCGRNYQLFSPADSFVIAPVEVMQNAKAAAGPLRILSDGSRIRIIQDRAFTGQPDVRIYSISGKCLYEGSVNATGSGMILLDKCLPAGLYIVEINEANRLTKGKVLLK